jgi:hypothetical protein
MSHQSSRPGGRRTSIRANVQLPKSQLAPTVGRGTTRGATQSINRSMTQTAESHSFERSLRPVPQQKAYPRLVLGAQFWSAVCLINLIVRP